MKRGDKLGVLEGKEAYKFVANQAKLIKHLDSLVESGNLATALELLGSSKGKIIITGIGKSGLIGEKLAATFTSLSHPAIYLHPVDAMHGDLGLVSDGDLLLAISHSGESKELLRLIDQLKNRNLKIISITGNSYSKLAKNSDVCLAYKFTREGSVHNLAPMASTTVSLVLGDLLAHLLSLRRGVTKKQFADHHPGGSLGMQLTKVQELMCCGSKIPLINEVNTFKNALKEITRKRLGITGVINKGRQLIGVISDGDIRRLLLKKTNLMDLPVIDLMTRHPKTISAQSSLLEAMVLMEKHKITSLFVVDNKNRPTGIIHMHDIVEVGIV